GGGEVYIGGGWQGKDSSIRNADKVVVKDGARIDVSATQQGNGGTAVLWSESFTNFRGQISARGGENGGNGGQVETSSHGNLQAFGSVSASAKKGKAGNWLLDPLDITIVNGADNAVTETNDTLSQPPHTQFTPTAEGSQVSNTSINDELNNGTSVTVLTSSATSGANQKGNITVDADINKTSGTDATLTLKADGNINVNKNITSTHGKLNVNLAAANTSSTGTITLGNNVSITTNGGNITAGTANASNSVTINVTGTTLNTSSGSQAGNITLNGSRVNVTNANITAGNFTLNATANGSNLNNVTLMATHDIILTGSNTTGVGLQLNGTNTLNATNGSISLTGNSTNGTGLFLGGNKNLSASNGNINLTGNSQTGVGLYLGERNSTNTLNATNGSINLNGVSVAKSAIEIRGNNTLTADNINLTGNSTKSFGIDAQDGANTLNATNGSINLTGNSTNGTGLQLMNNGTNTLNAAGDVNINGTGHLSSGAGPGVGFIYIQNATITSSTGNITIDGNVSNIESAVFLRDVTLNASKGDISIRGTSDYAAKHTHVFQGGTVWLYNTNMTAQNIDINATNTNATVAGTYLYGDALFLAGNLTFTGNTTINATANRGAAILFGATTGHGPSTLNMTFSNGSVVMNATNNGTSEISGDITEYKSAIATDMWSGPGGTMNNPLHVNISLSNSNLTICASSEYADGIYGSNVNSFWNITGTGNASITGMSQHGNGVSLEDININASGLNGTTTLTGIATGNGNGVDISGNTTLINVVVNGNGVNGSGVDISGNLTSSGNSTVTGNASGNGTGVDINGTVTGG
ncbi:TPA: S-layer family protein, partial [Escherichia coli]|nr:S-layer family protein [Escherichia coli]